VYASKTDYWKRRLKESPPELFAIHNFFKRTREANMKPISTMMLLVVAFALALAQTKDREGNQKAGITEGAAMKTHARATFALKGWDEKPYNEMNGIPKLTRVSVTKSYQGDITGEGKLEYLMMYRDDGSASFVGLERVVGSVAGRSGSFVLQHSGTFKGGVATVTLLVVPGSGAGDLRGLRGDGGFAVGHQSPYSMTLDYDFE
jgi:hypothetical protein